jgi:hydroxymethylbilane synthase
LTTIRIGTRGSLLSRTQTEHVIQALQALHGDLRVDVVVIRTAGDRTTGPLRPVGRAGLFVAEIERALLAGEIDLAVHSLKDLPTAPTPGLAIAAIPPREDPRDVLVANVPSLRALPAGARVGTASPRRAAQLRAHRPDLQVVPLRGNVDTRVRKVRSGEVDAAILAAAGLLRAGLAHEIAEYLDPQVILPAPGQGALAVQVRAGDRRLTDLVAPLDDPQSRAATTAERAFLHHLGGGCAIPAAALATCDPTTRRLRLCAAVASEDGSRVARIERSGPMEAAERIGQEAAEALWAAYTVAAS